MPHRYGLPIFDKVAKQFIEGTIVFWQKVLEQLEIQWYANNNKIINPNLNLTLYTKINSKWIIDLNVRCRIIQLLEDHIGENLWELGFARVLRQSTGKHNV